MKIVFMGSAELAVPSLHMLVDSRHDVCMVVSCPPRPKGRRLRLAPCPVAAAAEQLALPLFTPANINEPDNVKVLAGCRAELLVVVAYGQILKPAILDLAPLGCLNIHAGLLPKYRGAAPIQWAIANGETESGVTAMYVDEKMDHGDILDQVAVPIGRHETAGDLHDRLALTGAELLGSVVERIANGTAERHPQDHARATYAPKLKKEDGNIDWTLSARTLDCRIRAFHPWPGCTCGLPASVETMRGSGKRLRILLAAPVSGGGLPGTAATPGTILDLTDRGPIVQTGEGALRLLEVQPEGRRRMPAGDYLRGHPIHPGDSFR